MSLKFPSEYDYPETESPYNYIKAYVASAGELREAVVIMQTAVKNITCDSADNQAIKKIMQKFVSKFEQP